MIAVIGVALAAGLFVALRPDGGSPRTTAEPPSTSGREIGPEETQPAPTAPAITAKAVPAAPEPARVRIAVRDGRVEGGVRRASVRKGRQLVLVVSADVVDEVHVHGYDLKRPVAPGKPARVAFRATLAGRFEVELEERKLLIAQLEVRP